MFRKEKKTKEKENIEKLEEKIRAKIKKEEELETVSEEPEEEVEEEEVEEEDTEVVGIKGTPKGTSKEQILVVKELPTQEVRQVKNEDGTLVNLITIEEALTKILND